jgi:hypothetical protein
VHETRGALLENKRGIGLSLFVPLFSSIPREFTNMASTITGQDGACTILNEAKAPVSTIACLTPGITSPAASSSVTEIQAAPPPPSSPAGGQSNLLAPVSTPNLSASVTAASTSGHNGTPIPSQSTQAIVKNGGLASGAVAGVAIGMLFAGVLIAGAVFFFLLRHQKRRQASHSPINHLAPSGYESRPEKGPVTVSRSVSNNISDLVPQPASDDNIKNNVSKIRDNIKNHVRTYCHSAPITSGVNEAALRNVASATSLSTGALVGALSNPSSRQDALRLIVAWIILSNTTSGKSSELLPSQLSGLSAAVARTADNPSKHFTFCIFQKSS